MSDLVPGTPEYQEAYDKEMKRLETDAKNDATTTSEEKPEETKPKESVDKTVDKTETKPVEIPAEVKQKLESMEKALKDTQAWGTRTSQELARLKRERELDKHASTRPAILDQNPELESAIKYVSGSPVKHDPKEDWLRSVSQAIPDVEQLLANEEFRTKAQERKNQYGPDWDDPLIAIRELNSLKVDHVRTQAVTQAVEKAREQARIDFEAKAKKKTAMEVPGGSGGQESTNKEDGAEKIWNMSEADFAKMRAKTLGYS